MQPCLRIQNPYLYPSIKIFRDMEQKGILIWCWNLRERARERERGEWIFVSLFGGAFQLMNYFFLHVFCSDLSLCLNF